MRLAVVATALFAVLPALASVNAGADSHAIAARHEQGAVGHGTGFERRHAHRRRNEKKCKSNTEHHGTHSADSTESTHAGDSSATATASASASSDTTEASASESASDASSASAPASSSTGINAGGRELYKQNPGSNSASDSPSSESASGSATATDGSSSAGSASSTEAAASSGTASSTDSSPSSTSSAASGGSGDSPGANGGKASFYNIGSGVFCEENKDKISNNSPIVAMSQTWWNENYGSLESHDPCGKSMTIKWNGIVKQATVQDQCEACTPEWIDLPKGFWTTFTSDESLGMLGDNNDGNHPLTWTWD